MDTHNGNDNGDRLFRSTVYPPARLPEIPNLYNQLFPFQETASIAGFSPFETLESSFSRLGFDDSNTQNRRPTNFNNDFHNRYSINHQMMNNQGFDGFGFPHSASVQETELARINHMNGSFRFPNNPRNVSSSSTTPNPLFDLAGLENLRGMILPFSKDRYYSHLLQQIIEEEESGEKIEMIFNEVIQFVDELMMDPFGHHVFQKLLEKCNDLQIAQIVDVVAGNPFYVLVKVCTDSHGTRAIQALLKSLRTQEQVSMVTGSLSIIAVPLSKSNNGHHVVQYCLKHFSPEDNMFLMIEVARNCYQIAIDQHGCCLLQQCIAYCVGERNGCLADIRRLLIGDIVNNVLRLSDHCYGNYVVQYLLELRDPQITGDLMRHLEGSYAFLSRNKYGSHVVQKCLTESGDKHSQRIMYELLKDISMLLIDPFGNYVMQSALMVSKSNMRDVLMHFVRENYPMMRSNKFGRRVLEKIKHL